MTALVDELSDVFANTNRTPDFPAKSAMFLLAKLGPSNNHNGSVGQSRLQRLEEQFHPPGARQAGVGQSKARIGRNPATGEQVKVAAKRVVKFRVAKAAKDAILGSK